MATSIIPAHLLPKPGDAHFGEGAVTAINVTAETNSVIKDIDIILGANAPGASPAWNEAGRVGGTWEAS